MAPPKTLVHSLARPLYGNMTRLQPPPLSPCGVFPVMKSSTKDTVEHISDPAGRLPGREGDEWSSQQMY